MLEKDDVRLLRSVGATGGSISIGTWSTNGQTEHLNTRVRKV